MISVRFNEQDLARILGKLNRTLEQSAGHLFHWQIRLLDEYQQTVTEGMGTLEARGGYPKIHFETVTGTEYWRALRPGTIEKKLERQGTKIPKGKKGKKGNPHEIYKTYASKVTIWLDTGETKRQVVRIDGTFAGIPAGASSLEKAHRVEEGDESVKNFKARPLFAVANYLIINAVHTMLQNDNSWLAKAIRKEFCSLAKANGWGA